MKINSIAKAIVLPALLLPVINSPRAHAQPPEVSKPVLKDELSSNKYKITKVITEPWKIEEKFDAFYKVDTKNKGWFYIAMYKDGRTDSIFEAAFDKEEKKKGLLFPKPIDVSKPVAIVDAKEAGLDGVFEVYDKGEWYEVHYQFSPLLVTPSHTTVSATFLINIESAIKKLPKQFTDELHKHGVQVIIGKNVDDTYYYYDPKKRDEDRWKGTNSNKSFELTENGGREKAAELLSAFPQSAEYIRQDVLPRYKINISIEQIRKDIYPDYLKKKDVKDKK